jgi:hypothetical protein
MKKILSILLSLIFVLVVPGCIGSSNINLNDGVNGIQGKYICSVDYAPLDFTLNFRGKSIFSSANDLIGYVKEDGFWIKNKGMEWMFIAEEICKDGVFGKCILAYSYDGENADIEGGFTLRFPPGVNLNDISRFINAAKSLWPKIKINI